MPVPVVGLTGVTAITSGGFNAFALKSDGTVWGWGGGYLGTSTHDTSSVPVRVPGLSNMVALASSGQTTYAVKSDGTAWAWGWNVSGELGTGTADESVATPVRIPSLSGVVSVAAGTSVGYAVKSDGTVWAWGDNMYSQLGNDSVYDYTTTPVRVPGLSGAGGLGSGWQSGYAVVANP